ncbi:MAG: hypothetical protein KIS78_28200 [Labilithrix sp.]|nr:hypothetical protein [Labilithrix sp.]
MVGAAGFAGAAAGLPSVAAAGLPSVAAAASGLPYASRSSIAPRPSASICGSTVAFSPTTTIVMASEPKYSSATRFTSSAVTASIRADRFS